jgi:hypothetical protein
MAIAAASTASATGTSDSSSLRVAFVPEIVFSAFISLLVAIV